MFRRARGFTLVELLTVLAIIAILAGVLFPVFKAAKNSARRSTCLSNIRQSYAATTMYMGDYDDYFMPVNHKPGSQPSRLDRTWVQMILPYSSSFAIFHCPSDISPRDVTEAAFDEDLVPGDIYTKYYAASMRVDYGYNYIYLSPVVSRNGHWASEPKQGNSVTDPSHTILFVDSIWDRTPEGNPTGGGNWLVVPPCRYARINGAQFDSFTTRGAVYTPYYGWGPDKKSARIYGNAWPWHDGWMNVMRVDGSAKAIQPTQLLAGCSGQPSSWQGFITDSSAYYWDTQ